MVYSDVLNNYFNDDNDMKMKVMKLIFLKQCYIWAQEQKTWCSTQGHNFFCNSNLNHVFQPEVIESDGVVAIERAKNENCGKSERLRAQPSLHLPSTSLSHHLCLAASPPSLLILKVHSPD
ncbi:unnamed protein product [Trifolium pratense]|uniref:Uncharacterized protein n=1 Tax=Trifolium pratense TaxID=57577 RepID=A0ACB0JIJ5_TRIPR|nr:unnamed protein product [Trifolium pratense]